MKKGLGMVVMGAVLVAGCASWVAGRWSRPTGVVVSMAGRDQALVTLLRRAKWNVYLRTERLELVPAGNELVQACQRRIPVTVELPLQAGADVQGASLPRVLMELGAIVTFRSDAAGRYRGTYLEVDGKSFLYSASPLVPSAEGSQVSYISGPLPRPDLGR